MATREQVEELKSKMAEQRGVLLDVARSMSPEESLKVPVDAEGEEQWTALEQLAHLWEMERNYDAWVLAALETNGVDLTGVQGKPVAIPVQDANGSSIEEMVRYLEIERAYTNGLIDALRLEDFDRTAVSPIFGELTVLQWLRSFYRHDRQHAAQLEGRASDYKPRFAGGREPNQRLARLRAIGKA
jgi:hypothetical protein